MVEHYNKYKISIRIRTNIEMVDDSDSNLLLNILIGFQRRKRFQKFLILNKRIFI